MELSSDLYDDAARVYTHMVERDSSDAADAIRQICSSFGARAALRAALIIQLLRMEICQGNYPPLLRFYGYLLQDIPDVVPLLEQAVAFCLQAWGIRDLDVQLQVGVRLYS
jgi:hypothetical protein